MQLPEYFPVEHRLPHTAAIVPQAGEKGKCGKWAVTHALAMISTWASRAANMDNPEKSEYVGKIGFAPAAKSGLC